MNLLLAVILACISSVSCLIDCHTACRSCRDEQEAPELLNILCSMCQECKERRQERQDTMRKGTTTTVKTTPQRPNLLQGWRKRQRNFVSPGMMQVERHPYTPVQQGEDESDPGVPHGCPLPPLCNDGEELHTLPPCQETLPPTTWPMTRAPKPCPVQSCQPCVAPCMPLCCPAPCSTTSTQAYIDVYVGIPPAPPPPLPQLCC